MKTFLGYLSKSSHKRYNQLPKVLIWSGSQVISIVEVVGRLTIFSSLLLRSLSSTRGLVTSLIKQIFFVGTLSLPIILVAGLFVGMVLGFQGYYTLVDFGAEESLGVLVSLSLIRELGPVLSGILFAGRAGSALTTEIALMKTTQQLLALEMMGIDPVNRIILPRFMAGVISLPALNMLFIMVGLIGGWLIGAHWLGVDGGSYWSQMQVNVDWYKDILNGVIKSIVFGISTTLLALFFGYDSAPTAEGASLATTKTVVYGSLAILGLDFILTAAMF